MHDTPSTSSSKIHSESSAETLNVWHLWGGYTGLIPFFGLSLLSIAGFSFAPAALISYAALIFSFLCGVIWFVSLKRPQTSHIAVVALGGMLWSWCWLLFPNIDWTAAAGLSFALLWVYERKTLGKDYGDQFLALRQKLTFGAIASLLANVILTG